MDSTTHRSDSTVPAAPTADDCQGLRLIGDYLVSVRPAATRTMEWIVVATTGQSGWLDLSWGSYGQSRRLDFTLL